MGSRIDSTDNYEKFLLHAKDAVVIFDLNEKIIFANQSAGEFLETPAAELVGQSFVNYIRPDVVAKAREGIKNTIATDEPSQYREYPLVTRTGTEKFLQISIIPVNYGGVAAVQATGRDITDEKKYSEQLELKNKHINQVKAEWEATVDSLDIVIIMINKNAEIVRGNRAVRDLYGKSVKKISGMKLIDLLHPECQDPKCDLQQLINNAWKKLTAGESYREEFYDSRINRYLAYNFSPISTSAKRVDRLEESFAVVNIRDITDQKAQEANEIQEQVQRELDSVMNTFVDELSHDFKTPLSIINTALYVLENSTDEHKRTDQIRLLKNQFKSINNMVNKALEVSLDDCATLENLEQVNVNDLIKKIIHLLTSVADKQKLTIQLQLSDTQPIEASEYCITRMLANLIENAIQYTSIGGEINIKTNDLGDSISISIEDDGIGIPAEEIDKVFDRFYRTSKAKRINKEGTGLGLVIVKKIIDSHRGRISIESEPGRGTRFEIILPKNQ